MRLSQQVTQLRILHAALFASLIVYGVVVWTVKVTPPDDDAQAPRPVSAEAMPGDAPGARAPDDALDPRVFVPVFGAIAALELLVVIPVLRRRMMPPRAPFPQPLDDIELDGDDAATAAIGRLRTMSIVSWALAESVAIFGVMAAFMFREPRYYLPFAAASAVAMLVLAPRRRLVDEVVRAARG